MDSFFEVLTGLTCWVVAIGYLILQSTEHWQNAREIETTRREARTRLETSIHGMDDAARRAAIASHRVNDRPSRDEWLGSLIEVGARVLAGVCLLLIGEYWLSRALSAGQLLALIFGPACLFAARWVLRRFRRNWRRFATGRHRREVLLHLAGIIVLLVVGVLLLFSLF